MVVSTGTHVIYSAVFGDYDNIIAPKHIHKDTDYVLFTDVWTVDQYQNHGTLYMLIG